MDTWEYGYRLRPMVAIVAIVAIVAMVLVAIVAIVAIVAGSPDLSSGAPEFGSPDLSSGAADFFDTEEEEEDEREALLGEKKRAGSPDLSVGFAKKTKKTSSHTSTARLPQKLTMRQTELSVKDKIWWANRSCLYTRNKSKTPHLDAAKVANLDAASTRTFAQSIGKWARDLPKLINRLALHTGPASKLRRCVNPAPGLYPKAEAQVFAEFTARRKIGLPVGEMWFTIRMARFAKSAATAAAAVARCCCCSHCSHCSRRYHHPNACGFTASHGWFQNFMARHNIVPRRKKNSKSESLEQRIGLIQRFHHTLATKLLPTTPTFIAQEQYQQGETEVALTILLCCAQVQCAGELVSHAQLGRAESLEECFVALRTPCGVDVAKFKRLHSDMHARLFAQLQSGLLHLHQGWKSYETESHRTWGRFPPHCIYNVDQVPLPFVVRV